jgi:hypothetical protein
MLRVMVGRLAVGLVLVLGACDDFPHDDAAAALGPETGPTGPRHRPGQPCLVCHGPAYAPGETVFTLAGTIYERASDAQGVGGAEVELTDAEGDLVVVTTNVAGNFAVIADPDVSQEVEDREGIWRVPGPLPYPVRVKVRLGGLDREMKSVIHREGSCAACHTAPAGRTSAGKIWVVEAP